MECRNCGSRIPDGKLYCPFCGEEVQLVPEYRSSDMELALQRMLEEEAERIRKEKELAAIAREKENQLTPVQRVLCVLLIVGCAAAALYGAHLCMQKNSLMNYGYLKTQAERAYEKGDTVEALNWISLAEPVMPASSPDLELMKADILWHTGGKEEAGEVLYRLVERAPVLQVYETLIGYLTEERNYIEAAHVLAASGLKELADMHPELQSATPQMSLSDGDTYAYGTMLTLTAEGEGQIHFTTDGTPADESAPVYTEPVMLDVGTNRVEAVLINSLGISSEPASAVFTVKKRK